MSRRSRAKASETNEEDVTLIILNSSGQQYKVRGSFLLTSGGDLPNREYCLTTYNISPHILPLPARTAQRLTPTDSQRTQNHHFKNKRARKNTQNSSADFLSRSGSQIRRSFPRSARRWTGLCELCHSRTQHQTYFFAEANSQTTTRGGFGE